MLENIGKVKGIRETIAKGRGITTLIYNNTKVVNIVRKYADGQDLHHLGITRFLQNTWHWRVSLGIKPIAEMFH